MAYLPKRPQKDYPPLNPGKIQERLIGGVYVPVVEYNFGTPADRSKGDSRRWFQDTLVGEEWSKKGVNERRDEMFRRFDNYLDTLDEVEAVESRPRLIADVYTDLDAVDDALRDLDRQKLDLQRRQVDLQQEIAQLSRATRVVEGSLPPVVEG